MLVLVIAVPLSALILPAAWRSLELGMSKDDVRALCGKGFFDLTEFKGDQWTSSHPVGRRRLNVFYADDRVCRISVKLEPIAGGRFSLREEKSF